MWKMTIVQQGSQEKSQTMIRLQLDVGGHKAMYRCSSGWFSSMDPSLVYQAQLAALEYLLRNFPGKEQQLQITREGGGTLGYWSKDPMTLRQLKIEISALLTQPK